MAELQAIFDQIVIIQNAITPPTGEKDVTVYDEPPETPVVYPSFINVERDTETIEHSPGFRITPYIIDMHLIFGAFEKKYAYRSKRKWIVQVRDAFVLKLTLNATATSAMILEMDFHPDGFTYGGVEYDAITFTLHATVKEGVALAT